MWPATGSIVSLRPANRSALRRIDQHDVRGRELSRGNELLELGRAHHHLRVRPRIEAPGRPLALRLGPRVERRRVERQPLLLPGREAAIEYRHSRVPQPAQQPPEPRGVGSRALIVGNHLHLGVDTPSPEARRHLIDRRQRMSARRGGDLAGQIMVQVGVQLRVECARLRMPPGPTPGARDRSGSR